MRSVRLFILALAVAPVMAFAAAQSSSSSEESDVSDFHIVNPQVNAWAAGTVTKTNDGAVMISGSSLPFLTARAQMHQEMRQKLAGIDDPQQRFQIAKQIKAAWHDKLEAAVNQKRAEAAAMTFKAPSNSKDQVVLDSKSIRELPFFQRMERIKEAREKLGLEQRDLADLYEARDQRLAARAERRAEGPVSVSVDEARKKAAAEKVSEKAKERMEAAREKLAREQLAISDLKPGDKVLIGFNSKDDTAFTIVRQSAQ